MKSVKKIYLEISLLLFTVLLKFVFNDWLNFRFYYITAICLLWGFYLYRKYKKDSSIIRFWGFQRSNFKESSRSLIPVALLCISGIFIYACFNHSNILNWHVIPIILLYPIWGLIQQFMVIGLVVGNLLTLEFIELKNYQIALIASVLFGLVHYPDTLLMIYAFSMEMIFILVYLKWKNLWSLAIFHGWISGLLIFYVQERDLWLELMAGLY